MYGQRICIGAVGFDEPSSLRLLRENAENQEIQSPYKIGQVWDVEGFPRDEPIPPHVEDFCVTQSSIIRNDVSIRKFVLQKYDKDVIHFPVEKAFNGALVWSANGSGYVARNNYPNYSTQFWVTDRPLTRGSGDDICYYSFESQERTLRVKFVGMHNLVDLIPAGTIVRLSLARWWSPGPVVIERDQKCFLQLSSWYF